MYLKIVIDKKVNDIENTRFVVWYFITTPDT